MSIEDERQVDSNEPRCWADQFPWPDSDAHKYRRGHVLVLSGGPQNTGAARLAAMGAARAGAGAVTVGSPAAALATNAAHLTSTMLAKIETEDALRHFLQERRPTGCIIGPAFGVGARGRAFTGAVLAHRPLEASALVIDADAITSFKERPADLFALIRASDWRIILTPHEAEFARLFPDLAADGHSKVERARRAARRSGAMIVLKGSGTAIAAPDGRAAINENGTPWLATAGSGDVLAGIIAGLAAQGMPAFEAACAAVWMHAEAARDFGPGLIAEDLPNLLPAVLRKLL